MLTASTIPILGNPNRPKYQVLLDQMLAAAKARSLKVRILAAGSGPEIYFAFGILSREPVDALLVLSDPVYRNHLDHLARLELQHKIPTVNAEREAVVAGSLAVTARALKTVIIRQASTLGVYSRAKSPLIYLCFNPPSSSW